MGGRAGAALDESKDAVFPEAMLRLIHELFHLGAIPGQLFQSFFLYRSLKTQTQFPSFPFSKGVACCPGMTNEAYLNFYCSIPCLEVQEIYGDQEAINGRLDADLQRI